MKGKERWPPWNEFCMDICSRFDLTFYDNPVGEWKIVIQTGSVMEFQREFEKVKAKVVCKESFAVNMFIGGLKEEIRHVVASLNPRTLSEAFNVARIQEARFEDVVKETMQHAQSSSMASHTFHTGGEGCAFRNTSTIPRLSNVPHVSTALQGNTNVNALPDKEIGSRKMKGL